MIKARLGIVEEAAARFGTFAWLEGHKLLSPFFGFLARGRSAHIHA